MITGKAPTELVEILRPWFIEGWVPIAQSTLTGVAASVTFSSIPDEFRTLVLLCQLRTDRVSEVDIIALRFNGDSGGNYTWQLLRANAAATVAATQRADTELEIGLCEGASSTANAFSPSITFIDGYALSSKYKYTVTLSCKYGDVSADADIFTELRSGRWENGNAITSMVILPITGPNWVSGCIFKLYGIR